MSHRLVRLQQITGQPLTVNPEYVVGVWVSEDNVEICIAGMQPFRLIGPYDDVVAAIDLALADVPPADSTFHVAVENSGGGWGSVTVTHRESGRAAKRAFGAGVSAEQATGACKEALWREVLEKPEHADA